MGFAFYPNDGAALRDAFQKQFPEYVVNCVPRSVVGAQFITLSLLTPVDGATVAWNVFEAALHLDSCVISGDLLVLPKNQGIGQRMMRAKIEWANKQHYTLLATIRSHNKVQQYILMKFNWQYVGADLWAYTPTKE